MTYRAFMERLGLFVSDRNGNGMREWAKMYLPDTSLGLFKALPAYVLVALANYFH